LAAHYWITVYNNSSIVYMQHQIQFLVPNRHADMYTDQALTIHTTRKPSWRRG